MKKLLAILALTATTFAQDASEDHDIHQVWNEWKSAHGKSYTEDEEPSRKGTFMKHHKMINDHNAAGNSTVVLGINQFADLTDEEFKALHLGGYTPYTGGDSQGSDEGEDGKRFLGSLPASVDWRAHGAVTSVKNQGHCGGCWAFAAAAALESYHYIKTKSLINFSEQQLINCDTQSHGCNLGNFMNGFTYTAKYGIETLSANPFVGVTERCNYVASKAEKVNTAHVQVPSRNLNAMLTAIVKQPVAVAVEANQSAFRFYKSGVITSGCGSATDHAVLVVGYTTINGHQAFIVKNSWGAGWGQNGYLYISTASANGGKGVCGIMSEVGYPTN